MENNPTWLPVVAAALLDGNGRVLMQQRPPGKHHAGLWEFPGGKVEVGETPSNALIREIAEELAISLTSKSLTPAGFAQAEEEQGNLGVTPIVIFLYTARTWEGTPIACEGGEVGWFTLQEAHALPKPPLDISLLSGLIRSGFL